MADNKKNLKYFMRSMEPEVVTAPGLDSIRDENGEIIWNCVSYDVGEGWKGISKKETEE
mgnify:CR=1 FL=1